MEGNLISQEIIQSKIYLIRGEKVMLDSDLALLYEVETKQLKRAIHRNIERFPEDFMFELSEIEYKSLRCQFGTLKRGEHTKYLPYVFTEHGILMLSTVLNSKRAVAVNIQIMRLFVKMRGMLVDYQELKNKVEELERKNNKKFQVNSYILDEILRDVENIKQLLNPPAVKKEEIGFKLK